MAKWVARLKSTGTQHSTAVMYSELGAIFQEWSLKVLDHKGSIAHKSIGRLVNAINNGKLTIGQAENEYLSLLGK